MPNLKTVIVQQSLAGFMGAVALVAMVWFGGEYLGWSNGFRSLACVIILAVWFVLFLAQQLGAQKRSAKIEEDLKKEGEGEEDHVVPGRHDPEELQRNFDQALATLIGSKMGKRALTDLPWFIVIGPPASGKTTLLRESSLKFPSLGQNGRGIKGLGGTRNCDWWFNEHGIILDTAGRWTTDRDDREEWLRFLSIVKRGRRSKPINGAIVAYSVEEIIAGDDRQRHEDAENIRERIDELTRHLGVVFPVYLLLTKCDRWPGFVEFFGDYSDLERQQVWGCTLPELGANHSLSDRVSGEIDELSARLATPRVKALVDQPLPEERELIYQFPLQFREVRDRVSDFVDQIFQSNAFQEKARLRGFYFTSGTQEGAPMDQLLAKVRESVGIYEHGMKEPGERSAGQVAKAYFIDDLFTEIIFPDRDLAHASGWLHRRNQIARTLVAAVSVGATLGLGWWLAGALDTTKDLLVKTTSSVAELREGGRPGSKKSHVALTRVAEVKQALDAESGAWPFTVERKVFAARLEHHYVAGVKRLYAEPAKRRVVAALNEVAKRDVPKTPIDAESWQEEADGLLRAYQELCFGHQPEEVKRRIRDEFWTDANASQDEGRPHADWYFSDIGVARTRDATIPRVVTETHRQVSDACERFWIAWQAKSSQGFFRPPTVSRLLIETLEEGDFAEGYDPMSDFTVDPLRTLTSDQTIYTGFRRARRAELDRAMQAKLAKLQDEMREQIPESRVGETERNQWESDWQRAGKDAKQRLRDDARSAWQQYLNTVELRPTGSLKDAIDMLGSVDDDLNAIVPAWRLELEGEECDGAWLSDLVRPLLDLSLVLNELVDLRPDQIAASLEAFKDSKRAGTAVRLREALVDCRNAVRVADDSLRQACKPTERPLFNLCVRLSGSAVKQALQHLQERFADFVRATWQAQVARPLQRVTTKYPFRRDAEEGVEINVFQRLFRPGGEVDTQIERCRQMAATALGPTELLDAPDGFDEFIRGYAQIQDAFWSDDEFGLPVELAIQYPTQGRSYNDFELTIGDNPEFRGRDRTLSHVFRATWRGARGTRFKVLRTGYEADGNVSEEFADTAIAGQWGFFRLLDAGWDDQGARREEAPAGFKKRCVFEFSSPVDRADTVFVQLWIRTTRETSLFDGFSSLSEFFALYVPNSQVASTEEGEIGGK
ncbi:MAG: type VI secretion system membrane subunit TssM [Planctomycetota bacterium]